MTQRFLTSKRATMAVLMGAAMLSVVFPAGAQAQARQPARPAARPTAQAAAQAPTAPRPQAVVIVRTLNTSRRFSSPVRTLPTLRRMATVNERDIRQILTMAGLAPIADAVMETLLRGTLTDSSFAPGGRLEWMALRRLKKPDLTRNVQWGGRQAFQGYRFTVRTATMVYAFIVPKDCGNLSLISATPVPPPPPPPAPARTTPPAVAPAPPAPAPAPPRPAAPAVQAPVPAPPVAPTPTPAPAVQRPAAPAPAPVAPAPLTASDAGGLRPFAMVAFGKQRRRLLLAEGLGSYCDPLLGAKGGVQFDVAPNLTIAPAVGIAANIDDGSRTSLFADLELTRTFANGAYVGTGFGLWDLNHGDNVTGNILMQAGTVLSQHASGLSRTLFAVEGRLFLDELSDARNNYQFWAGVRYVFR